MGRAGWAGLLIPDELIKEYERTSRPPIRKKADVNQTEQRQEDLDEMRLIAEKRGRSKTKDGLMNNSGVRHRANTKVP